MIILGIDPGYATMGCGVVEYRAGRFSVLAARALTTAAGLPFEKRLLALYRELLALFDETRPDVLAVEELYFSKNQTTGIAVAHARGVVLLAAAERGVAPFEYGPMQVKQAIVGYGGAEKRQVMEMTKRILGLAALPKPDDVADALAVAICHAHSSTPARRALSARVKEAVR